MSHQKSMHELSHAVYKLSRIMVDFFQRRIELEGIDDLHPSVGLILLPLLKREGRTPSELAKDLHMKAPTITVIANRLEDRGWIRRERGTTDRRQVHLYLTKEGREKAELFDDVRKKVLQQMAAGVNRESIGLVNDTLKRIIRNVHGGVA